MFVGTWTKLEVSQGSGQSRSHVRVTRKVISDYLAHYQSFWGYGVSGSGNVFAQGLTISKRTNDGSHSSWSLPFWNLREHAALCIRCVHWTLWMMGSGKQFRISGMENGKGYELYHLWILRQANFLVDICWNCLIAVAPAWFRAHQFCTSSVDCPSFSFNYARVCGVFVLSDSGLLLNETQCTAIHKSNGPQKMRFRKAEFPWRSLKCSFSSHRIPSESGGELMSTLNSPAARPVPPHPLLKPFAPSRMLPYNCITIFFSYSQTYRLSIFCSLITQHLDTRLIIFLIQSSASLKIYNSYLTVYNLSCFRPSLLWILHPQQCFHFS